MSRLSVTVVGAGTMGRGIAQVFAMAGFDVSIRDIDNDVLATAQDTIESNLEGAIEREKITPDQKRSTLDRLTFTKDLADATEGVELVIEAVPESIELKKEIFREIESEVDESAVIATNTSSLSITEIVSSLNRPERSIGLHFFNPVHILPLVEIIVPEQATTDTVDFGRKVVEQLDKEPITVNDTPGFASSRLGVMLGVEAIRMLESGVASPQDIDRAMELGYNHPMGPLKLTDHVGLDVRLNILDNLHKEIGERFRPPQLLKNKVRAGKLGKKSGEGFYVWEDGEIVDETINGP